MEEKAIIYTNKKDFFEDKGFFTFNKPIFKFIYNAPFLQINNKIIKTKRPLKFLENLIRKYKLYAVGFISYDYKVLTLGIKSLKNYELPIPQVYFLLFRNYETANTIEIPDFKNDIKSIKYPEKSHFINIVNKALKYIENGDIYQINLSDRLELEGIFNKKRIFYNLTLIQPTEFMFFFKSRDFFVISASMELFLKKEKDIIETKPIKGTRPRGKNKEEDKVFYAQLKNSLKEKAENLMITDLMRNDLGRIAEAGSVKVKELFKVERYETLYQMHSTVVSNIDENISFESIINNTFPPGSVTGAPKKRAVEIIDELERYRRYVYCGAHFFIKPNLDFISSVAIRQSIFIKDKCYIYVGAGIVADSIAEKEYEEIILKSKANLKALNF
ncbi:MAG TPA: anthranilate synthase component I family protein [Hydrogenothermaceae bacterium]|nr:anthranilate synthase component I family protein [Hydrogenothermaceae bacterium]